MKSRVGHFTFQWKTLPQGTEGKAQLDVLQSEQIVQTLEVTWKRDAHGIWLGLPHGLYGFDLNAKKDEDGPLHYEVLQRGHCAQWSAVQVHSGNDTLHCETQCAKHKNVRVRAQMPGKIVRVLVEAGRSVNKDEPLLVMEAMKMENEIRASNGGKVTQVKVTQGQAVEAGADLLLIEAE